MKISVPALLLVCLFTSSNCCRRTDNLNNPRLPASTSGWRKIQLSETTTIYGDFVLRKGDSVNNGEYGVEALTLYPATCTFFRDRPGEDLPSAELRFFKTDDNSTICRSTFKRGSARLDDSICEGWNDMIWSVVEINDVNTKSGWVKFNLRSN
jgi:hypothetical protein